MKLTRIRIHNFRSIIDANIDMHDFIMLVGANNAGKSNFINALRCFYGDLKWTEDDLPKIENVQIDESWVELSFRLTNDEWNTLAEPYKDHENIHRLVLKRYFKGEKVRPKQSNIYAIVNGIECGIFYGANNVSLSKCGKIIYIPALTKPEEQMKTSGPSPLRDLLNFILSNNIPQSSAYMKLSESIEQLNSEARERDGFLTQIAQPLNDALKAWNIQIDLSVNTISTDIIIKSLINYAFIDQNINNTSFDLDRFGHGFQRSVIFELIQLASKLQKKSTPQTPDFNPDFTLLLFEEPEAFLHPAQQENMAYHLHNFGKPEGQQIIITSHSPIFVSKNSDNLGQICRIQKSNGISHIYQLKPAQKENLLEAGGDFLNVLKQYIADPTIEDSQKKDAKNFVNNAPAEEIAHQHEEFRYQLWLDPDRAAMFFADKVLLVEGASEKALFNYLLENDWNDLTQERILIIDALGKYNFHRFISLFEAYGIPHGILLDSDHNKEHHGVVNQLIRSRKNTFTQAYPFEFDEHLEKFLDLSLPKSNHQKPLQILQALYNHTLCPQKLTELRNIFCKVLNISSAQTSSHTNE